MPYTLVKALVWLIIAFGIGLVIGWLLRTATARRQIAVARGDGAELERLRRRVGELEPLVDERTRLLAELEASRSARSRRAGPAPPRPGGPEEEPAESAEPSGFAEAAGVPTDHGPDPAVAAAVIGHTVAIDDLTTIEGIGPKIEDLCHGIGIRTWADLAATEVSLLRTMLTDAGARYKVHDPSTWPEQAGLLAAGRWEEFKTLTDRLDGGVEPS